MEQNKPAEVQIDYQGSIARVASQLKEAMAKRRMIKQMVSAYYDKDETYRGATNALTLNKNAQKQRKFQLEQNVDLKALLAQLDEAKDLVDDLKGNLSTTIEVMFAKTGSTEIKTPDGKVIRAKKKFAINPNQLSLF